ncbi:hypothetical protein BJF83_13890 [Nocardiopsis sp. CNR-923]|uniref:DUF6114 domain-containing protein n=1 Tax=Nocardiopsis sp. CNR-923 TaxID=1904965 RepID=UPI00095B8EB0|nr:DUF6114 domain-containing protein [Nocardiopsis sp. CNR-923]OLT28868.1 hypothetical protein BJF83_13890 [Nocardiopsis sp. CNR-923]
MSHALDALRTARGGFRSWRRTRPFWGGLLLAAAGAELLVAPAAQSLFLPIDLIVYAGIAGVSGTLIGILLVAIGVLTWFQPAQHTFFGLVGLLLALVSFVTSNFGGFVIGMLLGIVGGSLVFAWCPRVRGRAPRRRARLRRRAVEAGPDGDAPGGRSGAGDGAGDDGAAPRPRPRPLAALALPLALVLTVQAVHAPADWPFPPGEEQERPSAPPSEGAGPSEKPSGTPSPDPTAEPGDPDRGPGDPGGREDPAEPGDGDAGDDAEGADGTEGDGEEVADPADCPLLTGRTGAVETEEEFLAAVRACEAADEEGGLPEVPVDQDHACFRGSVRTSGLTADRLTMRGASFGGVVECPTDDGPRRYLRLTMRGADLRDAELWFEDAGVRMSLALPTLVMDGDVEMHVTRMHVRVLGIPLTFTPDFPPPLLLPYMIVTDVDVASPMAGTDTMSIPGFDGRYRGA